MLWFKAEHFRTPNIKAVEVDRISEHNVYFRGIYHELKQTRYHTWSPTWEGAHASLLTWAEQEVQQARRFLELANSTLGNIKGMKPPAQRP